MPGIAWHDDITTPPLPGQVIDMKNSY